MRTDAHRWLGCLGFSHGIHGIHRGFWWRRASHGFHRCTQIVRLRRVLWEDSLVGCVGMAGMPYPPNLCPSVQSVGGSSSPKASVNSVVSVGRYFGGSVGMAGCHTLLICGHPCNLWENILRQKLLWVLWFLWKDSLVSAGVWQDAIPS